MSTKWVAITPTIPHKLDERFIMKGLEKILDNPKKDLETYVSPFRAKNKPKILREVKKVKGSYRGFTGVKSKWTPGSKATKNDKFMFTARGTDVRYAVMSSKFSRKTKKGSIRSSNQSGNRDPLYISKKNQGGIEGSDIEGTLYKKYKSKTKTAMKVLMFKSLVKAKVSFL